MYELTQCSSDCLIESVVAYCHLLGIVLKISALQESDIAGLLTSLSTIAQNARLDRVRLACPRGLLRNKVRSSILKQIEGAFEGAMNWCMQWVTPGKEQWCFRLQEQCLQKEGKLPSRKAIGQKSFESLRGPSMVRRVSRRMSCCLP